MGITWGYVWGIWWWRCSGQWMDSNRWRTEQCVVPRVNKSSDLPSPEDLSELRDKGLKAGIPRFVPMDVVACGTKPRVQNRSVLVHTWNGFVARWSICDAGEGNFVCSPEFCLLQVARYLKYYVCEHLARWQYTVILAELCCELCGTYSKQNTPKGYKNRERPLTSVGAITTYCGRMTFEPGAKMLGKALAWAVDALNSPMETAIYLLLCLPRSHGGLNLVRPFSNYALEVPQRLWDKTKKRHIIPDLLWPECRLIVEVNGSEPHAGHEKDDQERMEIAQDMDYKVVTFRKEDIYDKKRFLAKAQSIATTLGQDLPEQTEEFIALQDTLMNMLLRRERWI